MRWSLNGDWCVEQERLRLLFSIGRLCCRSFSLHRGDETVSAAGEGFDVARAGSRVSESFAHLVDGGVQAVVEVDERVGGPELLLQLFARDDFAGTFEQQRQHLEGLSLQAQLDAALAQFACAEIEFEQSKPRDSAALLRHDAVV